MDESEKIIKEYFDNLPESFRRAILAVDWQRKINELGQKYSLSETQISDLSYEVLFVLVGIEDDQNLSGNIQNKLAVSSILSDEITAELEEKVFGAIVEQADKDENKKIETVTRSPIPKIIVPQKMTDLPVEGSAGNKTRFYTPETGEDSDVMPMNLPVSDEDKEIIKTEISIPRYIPTKVETIKAEEDKKYQDLKQYTVSEMQGTVVKPVEKPYFNESKITYRPAGVSPKAVEAVNTTVPNTAPTNREFSQRPQSVPRLDFNSQTNPNQAPNSNINFNSRWEDTFKNNQPQGAEPNPTTFSNTPTQPSVQPTVQNYTQNTPPIKNDSPIVKSYTVDPYREPVE